MKKLIPALCMLLVAACLMGTSTYAWFAAGTTVEATGMAIEATSSGGLAITVSAAKNNTGLTAADFTSTKVDVTTGWNNGAEAVAPTSTPNGKAWFTAQAADADKYVSKDGTYTAAVTDAIGSDTKDGAGLFYHTQVYVKTLNMTAVDGKNVDLYVQALDINLGTEANDLEKSLRVAFVCGTNVVVFAPYRATDYAGKHAATTSTTAADTAYTAFLPGVVAGSSTTAKLADLAYGDDQYVKVDMFVYYEGEDAACMSINAVNLDTVTVGVTFGSTATAE